MNKINFALSNEQPGGMTMKDEMNTFMFTLINAPRIRFREKDWNENPAECLADCSYMLRCCLNKEDEIDDFLYEQRIEIISDSGDIVSEYTLSIELNGR